MLPKKRRLEKSEVNKVLKEGYRFHSPFFSANISLSTGPHTKTSNNKFSIIVSKKIIAGAVGRNKLRRKSFHAIREIFSEISSKKTGATEKTQAGAPKIFQIAIFTKKGAEKLSFTDLKKEIKGLLESARVI